MILTILPIKNRVTEVIVENLSDEEINTLSYLLKKPDYYHNDIFINKKGQTLDNMLNRIAKR